MNINYEVIFQNIIDRTIEFFSMSNIVNVLTIITSIITICGVLYSLKQSHLKIYTQYILDNIFIDRKATLCEVSNAIRKKNLVVNIFGKRGVGKSNFLRFYCDANNHKLKKRDRKILRKQFSNSSEYKSIFLHRSKTFYIEISGYQSRNDLNNQISEIVTGKSNFSNIEVAEKLRKAFVFYKRIIIIIDNVNTPGLEKELENIIKLFFSVSPKFYFVIGSIKELNLVGLLNISHKNIELSNFEEDDVREFMSHNYPQINCNILADILKISEGLPILVNLYLKGIKENGVCNSNIPVKKYVHEIVTNLSDNELELTQVIALLSITKASIPIELLNYIISDYKVSDIVALEDNALIEYHPIKREIKMHEIFRDIINSSYIIQEQKYILKLFKYFKENSTEYESAYYAILVEDIKTKDLIIPTIEKAILSENYSFLLLFGEHIKNIFGLQTKIGNVSNETFYTILLGYLEGLIGIGDYPAAKEIIDKCALTIRENSTLTQLKLSLVIANLYHLQNQYQEAIASYELLINEINHAEDRNVMCKYEATCLWGIAHSYRHEGLNYALAELYYREAIETAKTTNQRSIMLKCYFELVTIYILQNKQDAASLELDVINKIFTELPTDQYVYTRIAYNKICARYMRVFNSDSTVDDLELLQVVLKEYELQKKRLQYNTFFDIGEYYRHQSEYERAIENYSISLNFSRKNHDKNLDTMSRLGLILCTIAQKLNDDSTIELLRDIEKECIENHLYTNKVFAELILDSLCNNKLSQESRNNLKYIGINFKYDESYSEYTDFTNIHLILM